MATSYFYTHLYENVMSKNQGEIPAIIIYSLPVNTMTLKAYVHHCPEIYPKAHEEISKALRDAVLTFQCLDITTIVMPCNTLQVLLQPICDEMGMKNINIVQETIAEIAKQYFVSPLIIATSSTYQLSGYLSFLDKIGIKANHLNGKYQKLMEQHILNVLSYPKNNHEIKLKEILYGVMKDYTENDSIILACTDLILENSINFPVINSIHVLLEKSISTITQS